MPQENLLEMRYYSFGAADAARFKTLCKDRKLKVHRDSQSPMTFTVYTTLQVWNEITEILAKEME